MIRSFQWANCYLLRIFNTIVQSKSGGIKKDQSLTNLISPDVLSNDDNLIIITEMTEDNSKEKKIGNYILGKTIGQGTFGKVKLGTHTLTGQKVAIKILVKEKIIDVADVERVSREIHILKLIRHPSIIQLYQIIETSKHLFLIMEYVENGELFDYIVRHSKLDEQQACRYFKHLISGVAYLHQLNIVHRDLKPQNLLIGWNQDLKIVDFGLSNTYKPGQMLKTACGSPCYAAPEMISSKKYNGLQVDIWSCGVILFAMVCGYLPFEDSNTSQLYKKILSGEYILPSFVSQEFKDLLDKILSVDPTKRATIKDIYQHQWCQLVGDVRLNSGIIVGYHRIPVDKIMLEKLKAFDFDIEYAERCIEANKHNHITTSYYLLLKKHLKDGYSSHADISSQDFDYSSIEPFRRPANEKKTAFFSNTEYSNEISLQNTDIRLSAKQKLSPHKHYESNIQQRKSNFNPQNRSNNYLQKDKNIQRNSNCFIANKKFNDLKMYLRSSSKKKEFYSEVKRRQDKRMHARSLHFQGKHPEKDENLAVRMSTQYTEKFTKRLIKPKYQKLQNHQNRFTNKQLRQKAF